jgi:hypothetical protein
MGQPMRRLCKLPPNYTSHNSKLRHSSQGKRLSSAAWKLPPRYLGLSSRIQHHNPNRLWANTPLAQQKRLERWPLEQPLDSLVLLVELLKVRLGQLLEANTRQKVLRQWQQNNAQRGMQAGTYELEAGLHRKY